ncbi:MAG: sulfurtransferase FdhD [Candidatus Eisenbacteria bacterium]|nr:sulfurtransferase FdhD [Candidatus Eisenbacteria bacterium]
MWRGTARAPSTRCWETPSARRTPSGARRKRNGTVSESGAPGGRRNERTLSAAVLRWRTEGTAAERAVVVREEPLEIHLAQRLFARIMRTPGQDAALAAGLLLAEGILRDRDDLTDLTAERGPDVDRLHVTLSPPARRRATEPQGSAVACGRTPRAGVRIPAAIFSALLAELDLRQELRALSHGSHAVGTFDARGHLLSFAEDAGRHNAMDKAIGELFLRDALEPLAVCLTTSRASFEMAQKASGAGVPVLATVSAPTSLAIQCAQDSGMTLVCRLRERGFEIYAGAERIARPADA